MAANLLNFLITFLTVHSVSSQGNNLLNNDACCSALVNHQHLKVYTPMISDGDGENCDRHYQYHKASKKNCLNFKIRADKDAHVALANKPNVEESFIEIVIGGWGNTLSVIRKHNVDYAHANDAAKLHINENLGFWISWASGKIRVGKEGDSVAFMSWNDPQPFDVNYFGVSTCGGTAGTWTLETYDPYCPTVK